MGPGDRKKGRNNKKNQKKRTTERYGKKGKNEEQNETMENKNRPMWQKWKSQTR